jgi:hypothetical protein
LTLVYAPDRRQAAQTRIWRNPPYFVMLNTMVPACIFLGVVLSFVPHDLMYGPQAALIAECFTPRLRYSGSSIGYQLASVIAGGPAPLIATALLAATGSGYVIAAYIAFLRRGQHHRDGSDAGLHQPRHLTGARLGRLQSVSLELSFRSVLAPLDNGRGAV